MVSSEWFFIFSLSIFQNYLEDDISYYKIKLLKFSSQNIIIIFFIAYTLRATTWLGLSPHCSYRMLWTIHLVFFNAFTCNSKNNL